MDTAPSDVIVSRPSPTSEMLTGTHRRCCGTPWLDTNITPMPSWFSWTTYTRQSCHDGVFGGMACWVQARRGNEQPRIPAMRHVVNGPNSARINTGHDCSEELSRSPCAWKPSDAMDHARGLGLSCWSETPAKDCEWCAQGMGQVRVPVLIVGCFLARIRASVNPRDHCRVSQRFVVNAFV